MAKSLIGTKLVVTGTVANVATANTPNAWFWLGDGIPRGDAANPVTRITIPATGDEFLDMELSSGRTCDRHQSPAPVGD